MDCCGKKSTGHPVKRILAWSRQYGRMGLMLCFLTVLLWQCRFVRCGSNLLPDHACESLDHWTRHFSAKADVAQSDTAGLVIKKRRNEPTFSLTRSLEGLEEVGYLAVTCEASWENAVPHPAVRWLAPRVVIAGYDDRNRFCAPLDHGVVSAHGTRDWHRVQTVMQLPRELKKVILSIDGFGEEGILRLRDLRVEPVRQRVWFVPATVILLGAWAWYVSRMLLPQIRGQRIHLRAFVIACGILSGAWFFVFPQGRTLFPSLTGDFVMGSPISAPQAVAPAPVNPAVEPSPAMAEIPPTRQTTARQPRLRTLVPSSSTALEKQNKPVPSSPASTSVTTSPQQRQGWSLGLWLRDLDRKWHWKKYDFTHFIAFFGIGLFVFGLAGSGRIWPLPFGIAVLGEIVPNLIYDTWDRGDWWDLAANLGGLQVALGIVWWVQRIRAGMRMPDEMAVSS